jgi:hypothetical protein
MYMEWITQKYFIHVAISIWGQAFIQSFQIGIYISMWVIKGKHVLYIACEMRFKDETYGLNFLLAL